MLSSHGLGVGLAAGEEHQAVDLPLGKPLGPFEQHVLDEVRQARQPRRLVERADRVVQVADHDRGTPAGQDQGPQARWPESARQTGRSHLQATPGASGSDVGP